MTSHRVNGLRLHVVEAGREGGLVLILRHVHPEFWWARRKQITPLFVYGRLVDWGRNPNGARHAQPQADPISA